MIRMWNALPNSSRQNVARTHTHNALAASDERPSGRLACGTDPSVAAIGGYDCELLKIPPCCVGSPWSLSKTRHTQVRQRSTNKCT